jgi:hypothetical protein
MRNKQAGKVPFLTEMVDSYAMLHNDYIRTDSLEEANDLMKQLRHIESQLRGHGCAIQQSTQEWEKYLYKAPEMEKYGDIAEQAFIMAKETALRTKNYEIIRCLCKMETALLDTLEKKKAEKEFYSKVDVISQIDERTVLLNVGFNEFDFMADEKTGAN